MILILALFIPMTLLQDSNSIPAKKAKRKGNQCPKFQTPTAIVGKYRCHNMKTKRSLRPETWVCRLQCPESMHVQPAKHRIMHRCYKGTWRASGAEAHCVASKSVSLVEQHNSPPKLTNELLNNYLNNSYNYLAMAYFFDRADVQLPGFHKHFLGLWQANLQQAQDLLAYINKRGGWVDMREVPRSNNAELLHVAHAKGHVGLAAMEMAIAMERESQDQIYKIMERVQRRSKRDPHLLHILEDKHLEFKIKIIKEQMDYVAQLRAFNSDQGDYELGEYELDNNLQ